MVSQDLFSEVFDYPDPDAQQRYQALVGVSDVKERLVGEAVLLLDHQSIDRWSQKHHGGLLTAVNEIKERPPLIILAGDVGTGKTELAETFADEVARKMKVNGTLYVLSLSARGQGAVGQMSSLIGAAFSTISDKAHAGITVLLIDEGDALAQSRELSQMHHEDRAGVNALIKGIDGLRKAKKPVLVVLCTNRFNALDPAIRRRAAFTVTLERPNKLQRRALLEDLLADAGLSEDELDRLVLLLGSNDSRKYGYTYSDIRQRLIPEAVMLAASRDTALAFSIIEEVISKIEPTRPFTQEDS